MPYQAHEPTGLNAPLTLNNGVVLHNRLAKAAMSERLARRDGAPTAQMIELYRRWASSGVGLMITGNIMIDGSSLEAKRNVVIEDDRHLSPLSDWAEAVSTHDVMLLAQLSHTGRQTMAGNHISGRPLDVVAPSAVALNLSPSMFPVPRALTETEIVSLIERFVTAAVVAARAGFAGVELHAAHGYLINQFLSPLTNQRTDAWGGPLTNRMRFLLDVVAGIEERTPDDFVIAVKLNSADFQQGGFQPEEALTVALALEQAHIQLLEISGGTYDSVAVIDGQPQRASTVAREAYFLEFAEQFSRSLSLPIMLTGGFRSRASMVSAVTDGAVAIVGLARPIALNADFPRELLSGTTELSTAVAPKTGFRTVDDLLNSAWYQQQIARVGNRKPARPQRRAWWALLILVGTEIRDSIALRLSLRRCGPSTHSRAAVNPSLANCEHAPRSR